MNPNPLARTASNEGAEAKKTRTMTNKMSSFGATAVHAKKLKKKFKIKKITRQERELAKKEEAIKQAMLERASATSKGGKKKSLKGRGRGGASKTKSRSNLKTKKSTVKTSKPSTTATATP